jgi:hypothetical protein
MMLGALGLSACSSPGVDGVESEATESLGKVTSRLLNSDEFLYLRCNATGWGVDASTRLQSTAEPDVVTLTYDVEYPYQLDDSCIFTWTNQLDGWGTLHQAYSKPSPSVPLQVPGSRRFGSLL